MYSRNVINQERSPIININNKTFTDMKANTIKRSEYSLKQNIFDPTKNSPPNNFIIKLQERMGIYK